MKYSQVVLVACVGGAALVSAIPVGPESHERRNLHAQGLDATSQGYSASQGTTHSTHAATGLASDKTPLDHLASQGSTHHKHHHEHHAHSPGHPHEHHAHSPGHPHEHHAQSPGHPHEHHGHTPGQTHGHQPHDRHGQQTSSQSQALSTRTNDPLHVYGTRKFEPDPNSELSYKKQKKLRNARKELERYQDLANNGDRKAQKQVKKHQKTINKLSGGQSQASGEQMPPGAPDQPDATQFGTRDFVQDLGARDDFVYDTRAPFDENGMPEDPTSSPISPPISPPTSSGMNRATIYQGYQQMKQGGKTITGGVRGAVRDRMTGSMRDRITDHRNRAMARVMPQYGLGSRTDETAARAGGSSGGAWGTMAGRNLDEEAALAARDIFEKLYARYFDEIDELD